MSSKRVLRSSKKSSNLGHRAGPQFERMNVDPRCISGYFGVMVLLVLPKQFSHMDGHRFAWRADRAIGTMRGPAIGLVSRPVNGPLIDEPPDKPSGKQSPHKQFELKQKAQSK